MPVIVVGADTEVGQAIVEELLPTAAEVRVFVSDPDRGSRFRELGAKVAIGDLSDASHLGPAAFHAFCAVLIPEAIEDGRDIDFASSTDQVLEAWREALGDAGVKRAIWVGNAPPGAKVPEEAEVAPAGRTPHDVATEVAELESVAAL